jgi:alpha-galactosidase
MSIFVFRTHLPEPAQLPVIYLRGMDPDGRYEIEGLPGVRSGLGWMRAGLTIPLGDFQSTVRRIKRVSYSG